MTTTRRVLVVDAGQTAVKVGIDDHRVVALPGIRAEAPVLPQLADVILEVAAQGNGRFDVAVGSSAYTGADPTAAATLLRLCGSAGVDRVWLTADSVTWFLGSLGDARGVVIAAGTGAVTLGVGADRVARVDGWGNVMGDAGSGFWIGREALDAVMRAYDGRGPQTALTDVVKALFPDLGDAYMQLLPNPDRVRLVASLSTQVSQLATAGDPIAADICERAGRELAHSGATAVEAIGEADRPDPVICLIGGVVKDGPVRDSCIAALRARWPRFVPFAPRGDALAGTRVLPQLLSGHPLSTLIQVATSTSVPALAHGSTEEIS